MVWAYLLVCVTSEITLSGKDLESVWVGLAAIAILVLAGNCVPGLDACLAAVMKQLKGPLYYLHSTLAFTLVLSTGFYILESVVDFALKIAGVEKRKEQR